MDPYQNNQTRIYRWVFLVVMLYSLYLLASAFLNRQSTGLLKVSSNSKKAAISISSGNTTAQLVGVGSATIRIKPGTYYLVANDSGRQTSGVATVTKNQTTAASLDLNKAIGLASVSSITYENIDSLSNRGISDDQISQLKLLFFDYIINHQKGAKTVAVDPDSIQRLPIDQNTGIFTVNFDVVIDNIPYDAQITYPDTNSLWLSLTDPKGGVEVFNTKGND